MSSSSKLNEQSMFLLSTNIWKQCYMIERLSRVEQRISLLKQIFPALCKDIGSDHTAALFHSESRRHLQVQSTNTHPQLFADKITSITRELDMREQEYWHIEEAEILHWCQQATEQIKSIHENTHFCPTDISQCRRLLNIRLQFRSKTLAALIPFATSYLCEIRFSAVSSIKTKQRSKLHIENWLKVAISQLLPCFDYSL